MSKDPVIHFEMPAEDGKRMSEFYQKTFGWETNQLDEAYGNYIVVMTTESDIKGPKTPGTINGGFFKKTADNQHPSVVIAVQNIREAMKKVEEGGGKVIGGQGAPGEPDSIPGVGLYCGFIDTEGNRVGMLQPTVDSNAMPAPQQQ